mmetsp:Transcript_7168/g.7336  ORF Transcript_7168/g.7336 Transcript_7168/m.7336 type:complete len:265 (-) Transcript_7168:51-845(-)
MRKMRILLLRKVIMLMIRRMKSKRGRRMHRKFLILNQINKGRYLKTRIVARYPTRTMRKKIALNLLVLVPKRNKNMIPNVVLIRHLLVVAAAAVLPGREVVILGEVDVQYLPLLHVPTPHHLTTLLIPPPGIGQEEGEDHRHGRNVVEIMVAAGTVGAGACHHHQNVGETVAIVVIAVRHLFLYRPLTRGGGIRMITTKEVKKNNELKTTAMITYKEVMSKEQTQWAGRNKLNRNNEPDIFLVEEISQYNKTFMLLYEEMPCLK